MGFGSLWGSLWGGSGGADSGEPDVSAPTIVDIVPTPGTAIEVGDAISFSVRDDIGLDFISILVSFASAPTETAFDGSLTARYATLSVATPLPPLRYDFLLRREGGWLTSPRVRIQATDTSGLETEVVFEWLLVPGATVPTTAATPGTKPGKLAIIRPFRRDRKNDFATANPAAARRARVGQILGTRARTLNAPGELLWDPEFGSKIHMLRHRSGAGVDELAALYVREALGRLEPTIAATSVVRLPEDPLHPTVKRFRVFYTDLVSGDADSVDVG